MATRELNNPDSARTRGDARRVLITQAAIDVLAERGAHGLTHRLVDRQAGLPEGSTSNHYRTREALLEATIDRHVAQELELIEAALGQQPERIDAKLLPGVISAFVDSYAEPEVAGLTAARYEIYLEVRRQPRLAEKLDAVRRGYHDLLAELLRAAGLPRPAENARAAVAFIDGLTVDRLFHSGTGLSVEERTEAIDGFLMSLT